MTLCFDQTSTTNRIHGCEPRRERDELVGLPDRRIQQDIGRSCPEVDLERGKAQLRPELFLELIHPATMYRRGDILKVGGYKIKVGGYKITALEDRDLWGRLVTAGYKIAVQPELLMYQRRHSHSLTTMDLNKLSNSGIL